MPGFFSYVKEYCSYFEAKIYYRRVFGVFLFALIIPIILLIRLFWDFNSLYFVFSLLFPLPFCIFIAKRAVKIDETLVARYIDQEGKLKDTISTATEFIGESSEKEPKLNGLAKDANELVSKKEPVFERNYFFGFSVFFSILYLILVLTHFFLLLLNLFDNNPFKDLGGALSSSSVTREIGKALEKGDLKSASEKGEKLADKIRQGLSKEELEGMKKAIEKAIEKIINSRNANGKDMKEIQKRLEEIQKSLNGQPDLEKKIKDLAKTLENSGLQGKPGEEKKADKENKSGKGNKSDEPNKPGKDDNKPGEEKKIGDKNSDGQGKKDDGQTKDGEGKGEGKSKDDDQKKTDTNNSNTSQRKDQSNNQSNNQSNKFSNNSNDKKGEKNQDSKNSKNHSKGGKEGGGNLEDDPNEIMKKNPKLKILRGKEFDDKNIEEIASSAKLGTAFDRGVPMTDKECEKLRVSAEELAKKREVEEFSTRHRIPPEFRKFLKNFYLNEE
ncbi:MAG: hypothetical protein HQM08_03460 [Candidatus Riflebacteria bacterium]|nr:hypothetical protein [Candidatus Riflebacteria bacterium]